MKKILSLLSILCLCLFAGSCSNDMESAEMGYLKLEINTLVSTHTRAGVPDGYNGKTLHVAIINSAGQTVMQTDDVENDANFKGNILLEPGTYTITATSAKWDGSDSGFNAPYYVGGTTATIAAKTLTQASITLTQANVKVTVNYDASFKTYFKEAQTVVTSELAGVAAQAFVMNKTTGSAYFPVAPLKFLLNVTNTRDESFSQNNQVTDVKARDHFIINYKVAEAGSIGGVHVYIDDATNSYNYTIEVPRKSSTALQAFAANAWSTKASLRAAVTAKTSSFSLDDLKLQWQQDGATEWTDVPSSALTALADDNFSYELTGLQPNTSYRYRLNYYDGTTTVNSNEVIFKTEKQQQIENGGFEDWYKNGATWYPNAQGNSYWSSSNPGSTTMGEGYNVTTATTSFVHSGEKAAQLSNQYVVIKFAAASLFTGTFNGLIGTSGAKLDWGVPFTSRPSALKGYMSFSPGIINDGSQPSNVGAPAKGSGDVCQIFCALLTEPFKVGGNAESGEYKKSTIIDWKNDPRVIAYGELTYSANDNNQWKPFTINLDYHTTVVQPKYMLIVASASKYGDYFYGSRDTKLYLDDFEFAY